MSRLFFKWMLIPAILLALTALLYILKPSWKAASDVPLDFAHIVEDKKLTHTLRAGAVTPPENPLPQKSNATYLQIEMFIKEDQLAAMRDKANMDKFKNENNDFIIRFNQGRSLVANFKLRGIGSPHLAYKRQKPPRLNYTVSLFNPVELNPGVRLAKFYLMNLIFDPHRVEMELSYRLLSRLDLFFCHTQFAALHINGEFQGIYLLVEPHEEAIQRKFDNVTVIYRRRLGSYETKYQGPQQVEKWHLRKMENVIHHLKGQALTRRIEPDHQSERLSYLYCL